MFVLNRNVEGVTAESLETEDIREVEMFFSRNGYSSNLRNSVLMVGTMEEGESFKFYKNRDRSRYIEVKIE